MNALKMEAAVSSEMLAHVYKITQGHTAEHREQSKHSVQGCEQLARLQRTVSKNSELLARLQRTVSKNSEQLARRQRTVSKTAANS